MRIFETRNNTIGVFRVTFFRVESSDFQTLSNSSPNLVANYSKSESPNILILKVIGPKNKIILKYSNIRRFVNYTRDYFT